MLFINFRFRLCVKIFNKESLINFYILFSLYSLRIPFFSAFQIVAVLKSAVVIHRKLFSTRRENKKFQEATLAQILSVSAYKFGCSTFYSFTTQSQQLLCMENFFNFYFIFLSKHQQAVVTFVKRMNLFFQLD